MPSDTPKPEQPNCYFSDTRELCRKSYVPTVGARRLKASQPLIMREECGVAPRTEIVVLIVEDELLVRYEVAQQLRAVGYEVVESSTAEDAIARLQAGPRIDVVFTDIQLAGQLTGWDVAEQFRAANPDLLIIYASGNAADRSRRVPGSLFFNKPYRAAEIVAACCRCS